MRGEGRGRGSEDYFSARVAYDNIELTDISNCNKEWSMTLLRMKNVTHAPLMPLPLRFVTLTPPHWAQLVARREEKRHDDNNATRLYFRELAMHMSRDALFHLMVLSFSSNWSSRTKLQSFHGDNDTCRRKHFWTFRSIISICSTVSYFFGGKTNFNRGVYDWQFNLESCLYLALVHCVIQATLPWCRSGKTLWAYIPCLNTKPT